MQRTIHTLTTGIGICAISAQQSLSVLVALYFFKGTLAWLLVSSLHFIHKPLNIICSLMQTLKMDNCRNCFHIYAQSHPLTSKAYTVQHDKYLLDVTRASTREHNFK